MKIYYETNELKHYGVKGMKWGIVRDSLNLAAFSTAAALKNKFKDKTKAGEYACNTVMASIGSRTAFRVLKTLVGMQTKDSRITNQIDILGDTVSASIGVIGTANAIVRAMKEKKLKQQKGGEQ